MSDRNLPLQIVQPDQQQELSRRAESLLVSTDLAHDVAQLESLEAYYIVRAIGLDRALPVLRHLSSRQLETCIDLDCWSRYDFTPDRLDEWLAAFSLAGPESLAEAFFALNYVVQLLFLSQTVIVYDPDTDKIPPVDEENGPDRAMTPDGFYLLELKTDLALKLHPFSVLDSLYQYDLAATHQLLSEVRVDLSMQIEEEALRFRNGRMQDLGFVTPDEAALLFSRPSRRQSVPRTRFPVEDAPVRVPAVYAESADEQGLLQQTLSLISDRNFLIRVEQELVWTINTAIIAYGEKTQDAGQISDIAKRVRDTVSLGLEWLLYQRDPDCLSGAGVVEQALELLEVWSVSDLFRHGFAACEDLQKKTKETLCRPCFQEWFELETAQQTEDSADLLDRAFVAAILNRHPLQSGFDFTRPEAVRAFSCLADLDVARVRLQRLAARICS
jgi:hypothetical protein